MVTILDQFGRPLQRQQITEPQTARYGDLHREFAGHPSRGLTPSKLAAILDSAEQGDVVAQYELFTDMEEKDAHILAELGKRRRAIVRLPWSIEPPPRATPAEKKAAERLTELLTEIPDIEDLIHDTTDAIGKGFACQEIEWHRVESMWVPKSVVHRPQTWFRLHRGYEQEIRLRDHSAEGEPLQAFGWITHVHRASSGYIERAALFRALVWPYLFKNYSVGDLAEFLEIYGIPLRVGKYPPGASEKEKLTLLRALQAIGHNAAGIMPDGMLMEFHDAATGDPDAFMAMIDWCERCQSKAILGATLTSQADRGSNTNALGNVHNEVRTDLRDGDARQVQSTLTRDLLYPIAALNGLADSVRRCPRLVFDTGEAEDIKVFAESLPPLVDAGLEVPQSWARMKLRIPEPANGEPVLKGRAATPEPPPGRAALTAQPATNTEAPDFADELVALLAERAAAPSAVWLDQVYAAVEQSSGYAELMVRLEELLPALSIDELGATLQSALAAARLAGQADAEA